jgi:hypothetical protein
MKTAWNTLLVIALFATTDFAEAAYRCENDGKISYSDAPCAGGKLIEGPGASPADPTSTRRLAEQKRELHRLEAQRHKQEASEEKEQRQAARASAARHKKCGSLERRKRWAQEDAASASGKSADKTKRRARRVSEQYEAECAA